MAGDQSTQDALLDVPAQQPRKSLAKAAGAKESAKKVPAARARAKRPVDVAAHLPVARIWVDTSLAHLDRPLDYLVPAQYADSAQPGVRVRVRLAGRLHDGFIVARLAESVHDGRLLPFERVVSHEAVLSAELADLVRTVADHYAGTVADVLRAAVPPRHAATEALALPPRHAAVAPPESSAWSDYQAGAALLARVGDVAPKFPLPRAIWTPLSGHHLEHLVSLAQATAAAGRSSVIVVPDVRDVAQLLPQLTSACGTSAVATLTADLGPAERYREFLRVLHGQASIVVGTRSAAFAPVTNPGLFVVWDDGDDLHVSPQAPFWHVREVLALRAHHTGAAFVAGGYARSVEAQRLVDTGWARSVTPLRERQKAAAPVVRATGDDSSLEHDPLARAARLPRLAWQTAHDALQRGPVLVQVPRRGYVPSLACQTCRTMARCPHCRGPLAATSGHAAPSCVWCGRLAAFYVCPVCNGDRLRAVHVGQRRTAEELGRAFPGIPVRTSAQGDIVDEVGEAPALVIATPGAEPVAQGGYAAALLLDAHVLLGRPELRVAEEAFRRWSNAVALVRGANAKGVVVVVGEASEPTIQALVRHDAPGFAARELADRTTAGMPPAVRAVELVGPSAQLPGLVADLELPSASAVLGPVSLADPERAESSRVLITIAPGDAEPLLRQLQAVQAQRTLHKTVGRLTVKVDPVPFG